MCPHVHPLTVSVDRITDNPRGLIRQIKEAGMKVGIAVKPKTDISYVVSCTQAYRERLDWSLSG